MSAILISTLRLNDWIYDKLINKNFQLCPTFFSKVFSQIRGTQIENPTLEDFGFEPISLTSEILKSNGFNITEAGLCWKDFKYEDSKIRVGINPTKEHKLYIGYFAAPCQVYYVHELQHFLSDCKIQESLLV